MIAPFAVFGSWTTLDVSMALPFVRSLREVSPSTRLVLFVGHLRPSEMTRLRGLADDVIELDDLHRSRLPDSAFWVLDRISRQRGIRRFYPHVWRTVARASGARPGTAEADALEFRTMGLQALRYGHYLAYLQQHPEIEAVVISDVRDAVFQRDPFEEPVEGLEIYLEDEAHSLDRQTFTRVWIGDLYGELGLEAMGASPTSCSGVTVGARAPMIRYLHAMATELARHWGPLGSHDQGVHNWLLHTAQLGEARVLSNGEGRVITMGGLTAASISDEGLVECAGGGTTPAIVHQYDRHLELAHRLSERYA